MIDFSLPNQIFSKIDRDQKLNIDPRQHFISFEIDKSTKCQGQTLTLTFYQQIDIHMNRVCTKYTHFYKQDYVPLMSHPFNYGG